MVSNKIKKLFITRESKMMVIVIIAIIIMRLLNPNFLTLMNIRSLLIGLVPNIIIAVGMTILLVSGVFDLSVGGIMALSGTFTGIMILNEVPIIISVLIMLIIASGIGFINGVAITKFRVNPLMATFGMLSITRSITLILTDGYSVSGLPQNYQIMGTYKILGFPLMIWVALIILFIGDYLLRKSKFLRQVYYIGGNEKAATMSGIQTNKMRILTYTVSALLAGTAGIILSSRLGSGTTTAGNGIELAVIAACVIGGVSMAGGEGTILGALLGVILLGFIGNALILMSISPNWHGVVNGVILIVAVAVDMKMRSKMNSVKKVSNP